MKKAIVFAGGGSKGAYQMGAWKALNELGEEFQIAAGTSIGSINAALYVQHDFDAAYEMWTGIKAGDIMVNGINFEKSFETIFSQRENLIPFIKNYIKDSGADVTPFHALLKKSFDPVKFFSSEVDYALMTVEFPKFDPVEITKEKMAEYEEPWQWIAASAACFPVFPVMEISGKEYADGGYYDNVPVAAAFKLGADEVTVIDLKPDNNHEGYLHHPRVRYIKPSRDLGAFLNFEKDAIDFSMDLGYDDTMKLFGRLYGKIYTFVPTAEDEEKYTECARTFTDKLVQMEAKYDFSDSVGKLKLQRVNTLEGCTTLLAEELEKDRPSEKDLFFAALEKLLRCLAFSPDKDYPLSQLLYELKLRVDGMYPLLEYDHETAFETLKKFFAAASVGKNPELKKLDDEREMLILTALVRTLQQVNFR